MPNKHMLRLRSVVAIEPPYAYTNDEMARALGLPALPRICRRIGIERRRTFLELDVRNGRVVGGDESTELGLAEDIARAAMAEAGIARHEIVALCLVSCTVQHLRRLHFEMASFEFLRRLELDPTVSRFEIDSGCDGFVHALHTVNRLFRLRSGESVLIVATSLPSLYFDRQRCAQLSNTAQFPNYVFGDAAAAAVLTAGEGEGSVVRASWGGCDPSVALAWTVVSGNDTGQAEIGYAIDFEAVSRTYVDAIERAVRELEDIHPFDLDGVDRAYFHQANGVLPLSAAARLGILPGKVALRARDAGNGAAASVPTMLAADLREQRLRAGDTCLLAAVGAGLACSAALVEF